MVHHEHDQLFITLQCMSWQGLGSEYHNCFGGLMGQVFIQSPWLEVDDLPHFPDLSYNNFLLPFFMHSAFSILHCRQKRPIHNARPSSPSLFEDACYPRSNSTN